MHKKINIEVVNIKQQNIKEQKYTAPAVERVLDILEIMATQNRSFTVTEISSMLGISVNSVFRIYKELENKKYVIKDIADSSYELTPKLYYLGASIKNRISLVETAMPFMKRINHFTGETVLLTVLNEDKSTLVIDQLESPQPIKFSSTIGISYDSYNSAMGKVMLASLSDDELKEYIKNTEFVKRTPNTIVDKDLFFNHIKESSKSNVCFDDEECVVGLSCIACSIFSPEKKLEGAIGISGVAFRMTPEKKKEFVLLIKNEVEKLSQLLGYYGT